MSSKAANSTRGKIVVSANHESVLGTMNFFPSGIFGIRRLPTDSIGNTTVTFQGVNAGTEIRVYLPDGTEVAGVESCDANHVLTWGVYPSGDQKNTVRITLLLRGYRWQSFQYTATSGVVTLPIFQITDLGYNNPA